MAIRIRKYGKGYIALCAAKSEEQEGDVYLDDGMHHALTEKFEIDFIKMGFIDTPPTEDKIVDAEEIQKGFECVYFAEDNNINQPLEIWNAAIRWYKDQFAQSQTKK